MCNIDSHYRFSDQGQALLVHISHFILFELGESPDFVVMWAANFVETGRSTLLYPASGRFVHTIVPTDPQVRRVLSAITLFLMRNRCDTLYMRFPEDAKTKPRPIDMWVSRSSSHGPISLALAISNWTAFWPLECLRRQHDHDGIDGGTEHGSTNARQ